jgi:pimeloyl-ACP methyl ester carboxylesterase
MRRIVIENAPTFLDECRDPQQLAFDLEWLKGFSKPVLLTKGDQSPPTFAPVIAKLSKSLPHADVATLEGTGHTPHATHPDLYVDTLLDFARKHFL